MFQILLLSRERRMFLDAGFSEIMAEHFNFKAPQYVDSWKEFCDDANMETFFNENEDPSNNSILVKHNLHRTPKNSDYRPYSTSVVSRSGKRCHSSFRDSLHIRERDMFMKKIRSQMQERKADFKFKARPADVLKKEPFWPYRHSRYVSVERIPSLETEKRSIQRQLLKEEKKKMDELFEAEKIEIKKADEEELKKYRRTLEFKATAIKK